MSVEDHSVLHMTYDRSMTARLERELLKFLRDFMTNETGYNPELHAERQQVHEELSAFAVEARMVLTNSPVISITVRVTE